MDRRVDRHPVRAVVREQPPLRLRRCRCCRRMAGAQRRHRLRRRCAARRRAAAGPLRRSRARRPARPPTSTHGWGRTAASRDRGCRRAADRRRRPKPECRRRDRGRGPRRAPRVPPRSTAPPSWTRCLRAPRSIVRTSPRSQAVLSPVRGAVCGPIGQRSIQPSTASSGHSTSRRSGSSVAAQQYVRAGGCMATEHQRLQQRKRDLIRISEGPLDLHRIRLGSTRNQTPAVFRILDDPRGPLEAHPIHQPEAPIDLKVLGWLVLGAEPPLIGFMTTDASQRARECRRPVRHQPQPPGQPGAPGR